MKLVLIILLALSLNVSASIQQKITPNGQSIIRIHNEYNYRVFCEIWSDSGYYASFYLAASRWSRWYLEPLGYYSWECK